MTKKAAEWTENFLDSLREMPNVTRACREAGISRSTAYKYRKQSKNFAEAWEDAIEEGLDRLEEIAWTQAQEKGTVSLLTFLLRSRRYSSQAQRKVTPVQNKGRFQVVLHVVDDADKG